MKIDDKFLLENEGKINESIKNFQMMTGTFNLLSEEEVKAFKDNIKESSLVEYVALAHVIDGIPLNETMVRYVNSDGGQAMRKSREVRSKMAYKTTSVSKARRREIALKASKTRLANPSKMARAQRKRKRSNRKRVSYGMET